MEKQLDALRVSGEQQSTTFSQVDDLSWIGHERSQAEVDELSQLHHHVRDVGGRVAYVRVDSVRYLACVR